MGEGFWGTFKGHISLMKLEMMLERSAEAFASGEGVRLCLTDEVIPCLTEVPSPPGKAGSVRRPDDV